MFVFLLSSERAMEPLEHLQLGRILPLSHYEKHFLSFTVCLWINMGNKTWSTAHMLPPEKKFFLKKVYTNIYKEWEMRRN